MGPCYLPVWQKPSLLALDYQSTNVLEYFGSHFQIHPISLEQHFSNDCPLDEDARGTFADIYSYFAEIFQGDWDYDGKEEDY